jgi:hypothetical protein
MIKLIQIALAFLFAAPAAHAGEALFGYIYTTDLVPKGKWELEQWITDRQGQAHGEFNHFDMSTEVEYGVTDNFQVALYANYMYANENANSVRGLTEGIEMPADHDPNRRYNTARFDGFSAEFLYRILNPYTDSFGLAFYVEPEWSYSEKGVEFRLIGQKNLLDDTLVLAANAWIEFEREVGSNLVEPGSTEAPDGAWGNATYAEIDLGASYRFHSNWSAGLEFRNHNEYGAYTLAHSAQDHTAFFLGPNIHYAREGWFVTLAILRQVGAIAYTDEQKAQIYHGLLYGDEHTTWDGIRLKVGIPF